MRSVAPIHGSPLSIHTPLGKVAHDTFFLTHVTSFVVFLKISRLFFLPFPGYMNILNGFALLTLQDVC